jgi:hypothetical protein
MILGFVVVLLAGCKRGGDENPTDGVSAATGVPQATSRQTAADVHALKPHAAMGPNAPGAGAGLAIRWQDPSGWKRVAPTSPMRKASYEIPAASPEAGPAELAVFYFGPNQGGDVQSNLQRWVGQFRGVDESSVVRTEREANGLKQHVVEVPSGTYSNSMRPGGAGAPQENHGLLGAVVLAPSGKYFFKLTGPQATVKAQREAFFELLDSIQAT